MEAVAELIKVPELRFPEFDEEITHHTIEETLINSHLGGNYQNTSEPVGLPLIKMGNLKRGYIDVSALDYIIDESEICEDDLCREGDLFFNTRNTLELVGKVAIWKNELPVAYFNSNILKLQFPCNGFMNAWFNSASGRRKLKAMATGTTSVAAIYTRHLLAIQVSYPSLPEQQKIAEFLTAVDEKIGKLKRKKELLEAYKKGAMQKLFSQEIRFKDDQGNPYPDWEEKQGNEVFDRITDKNHKSDLPILAISQEHGAIPREMIDYDISVKAESLASYKVVNPGDFIISLRSFQGGLEYSRYKGICSPAYIILRATIAIEDLFFKEFFKTHSYILQLKSKLEGIRDGKMVSYKYFSETILPVPSLPEQQKIAEFLTGIDNKITAVANQIDKAAEFKKGLLQKMFV